MEINILDLVASFVGVFVTFLCFYGFFSSASISLARSTIADFEKLQQDRVPFAALAHSILERDDHYILACRLGQLLSSTIFGWFLFGLFQSGAEVITGEVASRPQVSSWLWAVIALVLVGILSLITMALMQLCRGLVAGNPERALCRMAFPLRIFGLILHPLLLAVESLSRKFFKSLDVSPVEERHVVQSVEDIQEIVERSSEAGELEEDEGEMIKSVLAISDTIVTEVMTPRKDIAFVRLEQGLHAVVEVFRTTGFSRILVCGEDLDDVEGVLLLKDLLPYVGRDVQSFDLSEIMRPAYFCNAGTRIDELLEELRSNAVHLAVVRDEHGGIDGLVTLEDLVEEIVGDIMDEFDIGEEQKIRGVSGSGEYLVDGSMTIYDLNEIYSIVLPEGEYSTIAGFVMHRLGKVPNKGESFAFNSMEFRVERVVRNRVRLIRIKKIDLSAKKLKLVDSATLDTKNKSESDRRTAESKEREKLA